METFKSESIDGIGFNSLCVISIQFFVARSAASDAIPLLAIAGFAQELNVAFCVAAAFTDRNNMVELQPFLTFTLDASPVIAPQNENPHLFRDRFPPRNEAVAGATRKLAFQSLKLLTVLVNRLKEKESEFFWGCSFVSLGQGPQLWSE